MKRIIVYLGILALLIALSTPVCLLAQNAKGDKTHTMEQTKTKKKNKTPVSIKRMEPSVPPGQVDKAQAGDKEEGYEKTGEIGRKEGWDNDSRLRSSERSSDKKLQKVVNKEKRATIKERKKVLKTEKKAEKARIEAQKVKERKMKQLDKDEKRNRKELKDIKEERERLLKEAQTRLEQ